MIIIFYCVLVVLLLRFVLSLRIYTNYTYQSYLVSNRSHDHHMTSHITINAGVHNDSIKDIFTRLKAELMVEANRR